MKAIFFRCARWLADRELWWLLLCSPAFLFPTAILPWSLLALATLPVFWISRWIARGRLTIRSPLDLPILGFMLLLPITLVVSTSPALSLSKYIGLLFGFALYYALLNASDIKGALSLLSLLSLVIIALALVGADWFEFKIPLLSPLYQWLPRLVEGVPRTMRGGFHPNEVGGTLAMLIPLVAAPISLSSSAPLPNTIWYKRLLDSRPFRLLTLSLMVAMLILTQSRTAIAAAVLALLYMGALQSRLVRIFAFSLLVGLGFLIWLRGPAAVFERAMKMPGSYTWEGRPEIWHNAWRVLQDYPLTGIGLNTFAPVSRSRYTYLVAPPDWDFVHAHNIFLQVGVDFGFIGLAFFVALLITFFAMAFRIYLTTKSSGTKALIAALTASMIAYLVFGSIDAITLGAKPAILLWLIAGLVANLYHTNATAGSLLLRTWTSRMTLPLVAIFILGAFLLRNQLASVALSNLGQVAINKGLLVQATHLLEQAGRYNPSNRSAHYALAEVYALTGREMEAQELWKKMHISARELAERGEAARREGKIDDAERWEQRALAIDPSFGDAWYYLGLIRQAQGERGQAVQALSFSLETNRWQGVNKLDVERALAIALMQQGDARKAIGYFREILSMEPEDICTSFNLAQALSTIGDYISAKEELLKAIDRLEQNRARLGEPFYNALRVELARALTTNANRRGDLEDALKWAEEAKSREPDHYYPYADLAELYIAKGMYDHAIEECLAFLHIRQDIPIIYYLLGKAYTAAQDYTAAIEAYENALRLQPSSAAYHYALAEVLRANGQLERAEQELTKAKALGKDTPLQATSHNRLLSD